MKIISVLLLLLFNAQSYADGNRVGNGGMGVVCEKPKTATLLDFYEGDFFPDEKGVPKTLLNAKLEALKKLDLKSAEYFIKRVGTIESEFELRKGVRLSATEDSAHLFLPRPKDCKLRQLVIRRENPTSGEKRFLIDQDLWDQLSISNRTGLIAHEVIYEYFFELGEHDSRHARQYNLKLFRGDFSKMSPNEYWKWIQELKLPIYPK